MVQHRLRRKRPHGRLWPRGIGATKAVVQGASKLFRRQARRGGRDNGRMKLAALRLLAASSIACAAALLVSGCAVVSVAGAAAGAAISVTGAVVSTGVSVAGTGVSLAGNAVGKTIDVMTP